MAIHINPEAIRRNPEYENWQALLRSHSDGVPGVPIVVGDFPDRLVLVDCAGHKLVFPAIQAGNAQTVEAETTDTINRKVSR